jgi:tetratricopeptide (TPR) repeat protein
VARADDPESIDLLLQEAYLHYNMGNIAKFKELLELAVQKDPTNPELQLNLGIISSDAKDFENSKKYYLRAIELKPDYANAYINLSVLILEPEVVIVEKMNEINRLPRPRSSDLDKYDELKEKKNLLYLEAIPFLEKAFEYDSTNFNIAQKLYEMMSAIGKDGEAKKYKNLKNSLQNIE